MATWAQGFCIGAIVTAILIIMALCVYAAIYRSGTIAQAEEKEPK